MAYYSQPRRLERRFQQLLLSVCPYLKLEPINFTLWEMYNLYERYHYRHVVANGQENPKYANLSTLDPMYELQLEYCSDPWLVDLRGFFEYFSCPMQ